MGFNAAALTLTSTSSFFGLGTGTSVLNTNASLGLPWLTTIHAFCTVGSVEDIQVDVSSLTVCG